MSTKSKLAVASATLVTAFASTALAQQAAGAAAGGVGTDKFAAAALAAGLAIGVAALGGEVDARRQAGDGARARVRRQ